MHTAVRVRILLDVDGVLNAINSRKSARLGWDDYRRFRAEGYPITYSPAMTRRLAQLVEPDEVEVLWLTTWGAKATGLAGRLGLPAFAVAGEPPLVENRCWWKLGIAQRLYQRDRTPFAWLDDDIRRERHAVRWLETLPPGDVLAISPNERHGLQPDHLDALEYFVSSHVAAPSATDATAESPGGA